MIENNNLINAILKSINPNAQIRCFLVDYKNHDGVDCHKGLHSVIIGNATDREVVDQITREMSSEGEISGIAEIPGYHPLDRIEKMAVDAKLLLSVGFRFLYLKK